MSLAAPDRASPPPRIDAAHAAQAAHAAH